MQAPPETTSPVQPADGAPPDPALRPDAPAAEANEAPGSGRAAVVASVLVFAGAVAWLLYAAFSGGGRPVPPGATLPPPPPSVGPAASPPPPVTASAPTSISVTLPTEPRAAVPPCPEGERRLYGTCAPETQCFVADDCGPDERCFGNTCLPKNASADERCTADSDCLRTERCVAERCAPLPDDAFGTAVRALRDNAAAFNTADVDAFLQFYPEVLPCFWSTSSAPVREERRDPNLPGLRPLEVTWRLRLARNQTCFRIRTVTPFAGSTPADSRVALTVSYVDRTPYYPDGSFEEKHYLLVRDNPGAPFRVAIETAEKHGDTGNTFPCFTKIQEAIAAP